VYALQGLGVADEAQRKCDYVLLPELATCSWILSEESEEERSLAEDETGPSLSVLRVVAARYAVNPLWTGDRSG
jgi:predicted amidohydrolase